MKVVNTQMEDQLKRQKQEFKERRTLDYYKDRLNGKEKIDDNFKDLYHDMSKIDFIFKEHLFI